MDAALKARLKKRLPAYVLVVGMVALVLHYYQRQPSDVAVTYAYGRAAAGLSGATMVYQQGTKVFARVRFSYRSRAATGHQAHRVRLPDGDYDVHVELRYRAAADQTKRTVRLRRPLLVRGSGAVTVFLSDETT